MAADKVFQNHFNALNTWKSQNGILTVPGTRVGVERSGNTVFAVRVDDIDSQCMTTIIFHYFAAQ
jgi:hypothetical protein